MVAMKHYTARAVRSGKWWAITIDGLKGAHSQTRRLDQVEANAREVISLMTDEASDAFTVEVIQEMPEEWRQTLAHYIELENKVSELERALVEAQTTTAQEFVGNGFTVRDVGEVMGLSHQRVAQITREVVRLPDGITMIGPHDDGVVYVPHAAIVDDEARLSWVRNVGTPSLPHPDTGLNSYKVPRFEWDDRMTKESADA